MNKLSIVLLLSTGLVFSAAQASQMQAQEKSALNSSSNSDALNLIQRDDLDAAATLQQLSLQLKKNQDQQKAAPRAQEKPAFISQVLIPEILRPIVKPEDERQLVIRPQEPQTVHKNLPLSSLQHNKQTKTPFESLLTIANLYMTYKSLTNQVSTLDAYTKEKTRITTIVFDLFKKTGSHDYSESFGDNLSTFSMSPLEMMLKQFVPTSLVGLALPVINTFQNRQLSLTQKLTQIVSLKKIIIMSIIYLLKRTPNTRFSTILITNLVSSFIRTLVLHVLFTELPKLYNRRDTLPEQIFGIIRRQFGQFNMARHQLQESQTMLAITPKANNDDLMDL